MCLYVSGGGRPSVLSGQAQWPSSGNFRVPSDELQGTLREGEEAITQCFVPYARSLMSSSVTWWWAVHLYKDATEK